MMSNPMREMFVGATAPATPRTALVCEVAAELYGPAWRFSLATEFAIDPDEIDDCIAGRAEVPDFLLVGLLRQIRVRTAAHAAVSKSLAAEAAMAPDGDYSFPDALARNARIVIQDCNQQALQYDETLGEYCFQKHADQRDADRAGRVQPNADASEFAPSDGKRARPALYIVNGGQADLEAPAYYEPRIDARDRI